MSYISSFTILLFSLTYAFLNMQHASGKKLQDILEEAFVLPLNVEGEFYIGIPHGEIH